MIVNRDDVDVNSRGLPLRLALRFTARFECGYLGIELPGGRRYAVVGRQEGCSAPVEIRDPHCTWRMLAGGDLGAAEGYWRGEWATPDLSHLLYLFVRNSEPNEFQSSNCLARMGSASVMAGAQATLNAISSQVI